MNEVVCRMSIATACLIKELRISADFDNNWGKDLEVIGNIYDNQN